MSCGYLCLEFMDASFCAGRGALLNDSGKALYAIKLGQPEAGSRVDIKSLTEKPGISTITMLGSDAVVNWKGEGNTLVINRPETDMEQLAIVSKIEFD